MIKHRFTLVLAALMLGSIANAQTWVEDTISTGSGYNTNIFYSLEDGEVASVAADNWHIGLSTSRFSDGIITNSADKGIKLYEITDDNTKYGTDLTADFITVVTADPMSFYNSNLSWFSGAFNQASGSYGWGEYDMSTHWLAGSVVFGMIVGTDTLQVLIAEKQTTPAGSSPVYVIKTAKLDGTAQDTFTLDVSGYANKNFVYLDIVTGSLVDREPPVANWDFVFSSYNDASVVFGGEQYKVFGVINNEGLKVAKVDTPDAVFDALAYNDYSYDTVNNSIGRAWKTAGMSGTFVNDSITYFVKTSPTSADSGSVWQIVFTAHNSGSSATDPGLVALKKRKVYEPTISLNKVDDIVSTFTVAPNPVKSGNSANLIIDAKQNIGKVNVAIVDMNGRVLKNINTTMNVGFQALPIHLNTVSAGMYFIRLTGGNGLIATTKLLVQ